MVSRFVVLSDLHAHPWAAFSQGDGVQNSRLRLSLGVLEASLARAFREEVPWLFAGDLVHTAGYALNTVLGSVVDVLARYPDVPKIVCWGNHDARGVGGLLRAEQTVWASFSRSLPNFTLLQPGVVAEHQGVTIVGEGYQPQASLLSFVGAGADVALYHQTVRHSRTALGFALEEGIEAEALLSRYRVSIVGHVHHPQQVEAPLGQALLIPGSPEHHNFGDQGVHGWWVLTLPEKGQEPEVEFIPGGSPEFRTVESVGEIVEDGHYYRVRHVGSGEVSPEGVRVIAPSPSTVEARHLLQGVNEVDAVLQAWMREYPPEEEVELCLARGRALLENQEPLRLRPCRLKSLALHNFGSHAESMLDVRDGTWLVVGEGKDFPSNGAGKSTLWEALFWLLFGRNTKGQSAHEVVRWGEVECWVSAVLEEEGRAPLHIRRSRGKQGHQLHVEEGAEVWGASSVTELTTKLGNYLGLTPEIFQSLCYFSQEKLILFSSVTDGERKEVLADLMGLSAYQKASALAAAEVVAIEKKEAVEASWVEAHQTLLVAERERLGTNQNAGAAWEEAQRAKLVPVQERLRLLVNPASVLEHRLTHFRARWEEGKAKALRRVEAAGASLVVQAYNVLAGGVAQQRQQLTTDVQTTLEALFQTTQCVSEAEVHAQYSALFSKLQSEVEAHRIQEEEARRALQGSGYRHRMLLDREQVLLREQEKTTKVFQEAQRTFQEGRCPTCQQSISETHRARCLSPFRQACTEVEVQLEHVRTELQEMPGIHRQYQEEMNRWALLVRESQQEITRWTEVQTLLATLVQLRQRVEEVETQGKTLGQFAQERAQEELTRRRVLVESRFRQRLAKATSHVARCLSEYEQVRASLKQEIARLSAEMNPYAIERDGILTRLRETEEALIRRSEVLTQLRTQKGVASYWRHGFSRQGIQSLLVEEIATRFNQNRGAVFPLLTQGVFDVQFSTLSQTASGEWRERTEFYVTAHGHPVPYGSLSGGQKRRVDIGIMLVMAVSVADWMRVPGVLGLLILDEVFGFLDESGAEGLVEALRVVHDTIPTVYAITHDTHLQSLFPEVVRVKQDMNGVSRVEVG